MNYRFETRNVKLTHLSLARRLNQRILKTEEPTFLDVSGNAHNDLSNVKSLAQLSPRDMTATLMSNIKYFHSKHSLEKLNGNAVHFLTLWVVADLETDVGAQMLMNALTYMVRSMTMSRSFDRVFKFGFFLDVEIIGRPTSCFHSEC